jgi:hypothetical protein
MNNNDINIRVLAKNLSDNVFKGVQKNINDLSESIQSSSKSASLLTGAIGGLVASITNFGLSIVQSGINNLIGFFSDSVNAAVEFEKSMTTLDIIAPRFGINADQARKAAQQLGKELRIGVGPAAEGLQNLLKSGLNLEQATELMRRFTNEAITGKSSSISLAQAVQNLTFAYTTNNSALGNLSGISENFSDIIQRGRESLLAQGVAAEEITEDMAKYQGMIELTNLTLGSSEKFTGTFIDKQAELNLKFEDAKTKLGLGLLPILTEVFDMFIQIFDEVGPELKPIVDNLLPKLAEIFKNELVPKIKELLPSLSSMVMQFVQLAIVYGPKIFSFFLNIAAFFTEAIGKANEFGNTLKSVITTFARLAQLTGSNSPALAQLAQGQIPGFASGGDFVTSGPRLIMVGDNPGGRERVQITPLSSPNISGPNSGNTFNFYGYDTEQISTKIIQQIKLGY